MNYFVIAPGPEIKALRAATVLQFARGAEREPWIEVHSGQSLRSYPTPIGRIVRHTDEGAQVEDFDERDPFNLAVAQVLREAIDAGATLIVPPSDGHSLDAGEKTRTDIFPAHLMPRISIR